MSSSYLQNKPSYYTVSLLVLLPLTVLCLTFLFPFSAYLSNPLAVAAGASDWAGGGTTPAANVVRTAPPAAAADNGGATERRRPEELSILVGVHTTARKHSRRHLIRMAYALQQQQHQQRTARVDVRFVLCARPMAPELRAFVALEARAHGDVMLLDCAESADRGKTYAYFASLPGMMLSSGAGAGAAGTYDYVMKVDDDTFLLLDALVEALRAAPREDAYCGVGLPFHDRAFPPFMLGMGYLLSWDLVQWIATSDMVRREAIGPEDVTTGKWLNMGNKAKNRVNIFPRMYDYKGPKPEDFLENTIGVHQLKEDIRWAHTLEHFNLTRLEPSNKLYNF
ncbi:hypothetical protein PR202_gb17642 [Eleusine coracana subsp. coracana]|uniref:Hexosyltransferase n=1 Tax=Eleusine coracana subsp. coracana TaxID=191504 RepID=A0AAV5F592_ELECO|nr:hypothetical protein QOZ80_6BG0463880 [Eleusine coracana subsp. coracana]GJN29416.1 hypothetical protein PR202_gb17642 [Eleusine coracana subsp. coracana]